jgi:hypothetical protein
MTPRYAYDDPHAYHRRWDRLHPDEVEAAAEHDPLLFVADHVSCTDRREGVLAIHAGTDEGGRHLILIPDAIIDPDEDTCVAVLATVVERLGPDRVMALGLVHHRRGRAHVVDLDRRWQDALDAVCHYYAIGAIGVLARTESGAIVRTTTQTAPR